MERVETEYWVYGGVGVAVLAGGFIRENADVDVFVKETAFEDTRSILCDLCSQNEFKLKYTRQGANRKPKLEVIERKEILSVVPAYLKANVVEFRFKNGTAEYHCQILQKVERNISDYRFFTPPAEYIKKLFIKYLTLRPDVKRRQKIRCDARAILTPDEFDQLFLPRRSCATGGSM